MNNKNYNINSMWNERWLLVYTSDISFLISEACNGFDLSDFWTETFPIFDLGFIAIKVIFIGPFCDLNLRKKYEISPRRVFGLILESF